MGPREISRYVRITPDTEAVLRRAIERLRLSARAYRRVLELALTLADQAGDDGIGSGHVAEAVQHRVLDQSES